MNAPRDELEGGKCNAFQRSVLPHRFFNPKKYVDSTYKFPLVP